MDKDNLLVSVIVPVYNCEQFLPQALNSVLNQTYQSIEIIVVDDGSTDGSQAVAKGFDNPRIRYLYQQNSGIGAARNMGVRISSGKFFAFLDADDLWVPDKLAIQIEQFHTDISLDMVFGHVIQFQDPVNNERSQSVGQQGQKKHPGVLTGTMLIKRRSFFKVGMFETGYRVGEFIDWYSKAIEFGLKELVLPDVVLKRRIHTTNIGIRERDAQTDYLRILKAKMDRSR
jgi:glycosyltransferase involved in cell wall biosynthesis